jgi:DNA-binding MarR family transcriptional regulator
MQAVLDRLVEKGLVRAEANPRHKRSMNYVLTKAGIDLCVELQRRELAKISAVMSTAPDADFAGAAAALEALNKALAAEIDRRG